MEVNLAIITGMLFTTAIYLLLSCSIIRIIFGLLTLGNAVNILILVSGRLIRNSPPIILNNSHNTSQIINNIANPLPQALILTSIVISFSFFTFFLIIFYKIYKKNNIDNINYIVSDTDQN